MTFKDYIKNNHPDPDALICKPVHEALDELTKLHSEYLIGMIKDFKQKYYFNIDTEIGINVTIEVIKQS